MAATNLVGYGDRTRLWGQACDYLGPGPIAPRLPYGGGREDGAGGKEKNGMVQTAIVEARAALSLNLLLSSGGENHAISKFVSWRANPPNG